MTNIDTAEPGLTLVNVFTVNPEKQQALIELLQTATETIMSRRPGFISAHFHKGVDGNKVVNYAQWRSKEDFQAMLKDPEAQKHMQDAVKMCEKVEPVLCEVVSVYAPEIPHHEISLTKDPTTPSP